MGVPSDNGEVRRRKLLSRRAGATRTGQSPPPPVITRRLKGFSFWGVVKATAAKQSRGCTTEHGPLRDERNSVG
jgi:hypothetical protein